MSEVTLKHTLVLPLFILSRSRFFLSLALGAEPAEVSNHLKTHPAGLRPPALSFALPGPSQGD